MSKPSFIIAGERRSGSTTLYEVLKQHSQINMYHQSDMDFFIEKDLFSLKPKLNVSKWSSYADINDYLDLFDENPQKLSAQKDADLLWWKPAHKRLADHLPETKFLFVLRNPVKRAESQYWNEFRKVREKRTFEKAINESQNNLKNDWSKLHLEYKTRGCYIESLEHFFKHIPKKNCHVVILEQLFKNWEKEMTKISDFLNIDSAEAINIKPLQSNKEEVLVLNPKYEKDLRGKVINIYDRVCNALIRRLVKDKHLKNKYQAFFLRIGKISARKSNPVKKEVLKHLSEFYKPYNKALEKHLNISIKEWH